MSKFIDTTHQYYKFWRGPSLAIVFSILTASLLTGCGQKIETDQELKPAHWKHLHALPKPKEALSQTFRVLIWRDYLDPEIIAYFEKAYGTKIEITYFESNKELKNIFARNPDDFDLLMPSDYVVDKYRKIGNLIAPIRKENIPNLGHISPILFQSTYDPELVYSVPMFYSSLGVSFNSKKVDHIPRNFSLRAKSNRENLLLHGYRAMLDEPRISLSAALLDDGVDPNKPTLKQLTDAAERIIRDSNEDSFVIPLSSKNRYTAEFFINFLLIPEISAGLTNYSYFANSNKSSHPYIMREILLGPAYIEPPTNSRMFFADLGDMDEDFEIAWSKVKNASTVVKAKVPDLLKHNEAAIDQHERKR
jgi:spermidine/putrescine-binding protein